MRKRGKGGGGGRGGEGGGGGGQPLKSVFAEARLELCRHFPFRVKMERPQIILVQKEIHGFTASFPLKKLKCSHFEALESSGKKCGRVA